MKKKIVLLALLALIAIPIGLQSANATAPVVCKVAGENVLKIAPIALGSTVECDAAAKNPHLAFTEIKVIPPNTLVPIIDNTVPGKSTTASFSANKPGVWTVQVDWFNSIKGHEGRLIFNFEVSFLVLPESPIGAIALAGTAFGGLGGFLALRHRKIN